MLFNYFKLALRNLSKNRVYAVINIVGLALGLTVFLFGNLLAGYERSHDHMFVNRDRIFTGGSIFSPDAEIGVAELDSMYTAMAPLVRAELDAVEAVARSKHQEFLVTVGADSFYQDVGFADPDFTRIFDLELVAGERHALDDPSSVILTRSLAEKLFGHTDVVGMNLELDHAHLFTVAAVIEDLPADSHFVSRVLGTKTELFAPWRALEQLSDYNWDEDWGNLSMGELTYMLLEPGRDIAWLDERLNGIYTRHGPEDQREFIPALRARPLVEANTMIWDAMGLPVIDSVRLLGLMVLIIACVNYTNLAIAQSFGRVREVGLRKAFGASRGQLLVQFLTESITTTLLALLLALASLEVLIPLFNQWSGKVLSLNYAEILPFLALTAVAVGVLAGAYPALMSTRFSPIDSLRNSVQHGVGGSRFRSAMIGVQFALSIFMLSVVLVVFFQNRMVERSSDIFPKSQIVLLERVGVDDIRRRHDTLREELLRLPGVSSVTFSSQVPFQQSNSSNGVSRTQGDEANAVTLQGVSIDVGFLETYDIPLLAGRALGRGADNDIRDSESRQVNVVLNELATQNLGFASAQAAIGGTYFSLPDENDENPEAVAFTVVGVVPDQNFLGLHNKIKPMAFSIEPEDNRVASVRVNGRDLPGTLSAIERVWERINPDYPIQQSFLDDQFNDVYVIFRTINRILAGFAIMALSLALIGLFGLSAYMAQRRTREIGIRKVLGAPVSHIVRLLVWQFSLPVLWSLLAAIPLAYLASSGTSHFSTSVSPTCRWSYCWRARWRW